MPTSWATRFSWTRILSFFLVQESFFWYKKIKKNKNWLGVGEGFVKNFQEFVSRLTPRFSDEAPTDKTSFFLYKKVKNFKKIKNFKNLAWRRGTVLASTKIKKWYRG